MNSLLCSPLIRAPYRFVVIPMCPHRMPYVMMSGHAVRSRGKIVALVSRFSFSQRKQHSPLYCSHFPCDASVSPAAHPPMVCQQQHIIRSGLARSVATGRALLPCKCYLSVNTFHASIVDCVIDNCSRPSKRVDTVSFFLSDNDIPLKTQARTYQQPNVRCSSCGKKSEWHCILAQNHTMLLSSQ